MKKCLYSFFILLVACGVEPKTQSISESESQEQHGSGEENVVTVVSQDAPADEEVLKEEEVVIDPVDDQVPPTQEEELKEIKMTCESQNHQMEICTVPDALIVTAKVNTQISIRECIKDEAWFIEGGSIKVLDGCRAEFLLGIKKVDCQKERDCQPEEQLPKEGIVGVNSQGQPTINGIATPTACHSNDPEICTSHCTILVDGTDPGRFIGDTNGTDNDLPTFRFPKKGDKYCGGTGGVCSVQIACRNSKHNMFVTFKNPGAPASGEAGRDTPYRFQTKGWLPGGLSYGFSWKSAGNDGKLVILLGGHLQKDK